MPVQRVLRYGFGYGSILVAVFLIACGGSSPAPSPPSPPPQPKQQTGCATPAVSNPEGGGGVYSQIQIDPGVYGTADTSNLTVFGFSQQNENLPPDPQVMEIYRTDNVVISFALAKAQASMTLISPDFSSDMSVAFTYSGGQVHVTIPQLISYVAAVAD
jgi:hypothetical protein